MTSPALFPIHSKRFPAASLAWGVLVLFVVCWWHSAALAQQKTSSSLSSNWGGANFVVRPYFGGGLTVVTEDNLESDVSVTAVSTSLSTYFGYGVEAGYRLPNEFELQLNYTVLPGALVDRQNFGGILNGCKAQNSLIGLSCNAELYYSGFGSELWYKHIGLGALFWNRKIKENGLDEALTAKVFPKERENGIAFSLGFRFGEMDEGIAYQVKYIALRDKLINSDSEQYALIESVIFVNIGYRFQL